MRENGPRLRVRVAESTDDGESWGKVGVSELLNPGSGLDGVRLANGHWVLVFNDTLRDRHRLAVALSTSASPAFASALNAKVTPLKARATSTM